MFANILLLGLSLLCNTLYSNAESTGNEFNPCDFYNMGLVAFKDQCEEYMKKHNNSIAITSSDDDDTWMLGGDSDNTTDPLLFLIQYLQTHNGDPQLIAALIASLTSDSSSTDSSEASEREITGQEIVQHLAPYIPADLLKSKQYWSFLSSILPNLIIMVAGEGEMDEEEFWTKLGELVQSISPSFIEYQANVDGDFGTPEWLDDVVSDIDTAMDKWHLLIKFKLFGWNIEIYVGSPEEEDLSDTDSTE